MRGGSPAAETRPHCSPGACLQTLCFAAACSWPACLPNASSSVVNRGMMRMSMIQCPQRALQLLPPPPAANSLGTGFPPAGTCSHDADQLARPPLLPDRPAPARLCAAASALQLHLGVSGASVKQAVSTTHLALHNARHHGICSTWCCSPCHLPRSALGCRVFTAAVAIVFAITWKLSGVHSLLCMPCTFSVTFRNLRAVHNCCCWHLLSCHLLGCSVVPPPHALAACSPQPGTST